ncbi:MAG: hypothetical protein AAF799_27110 [Myxococcota bacterium]
MTLVDILKGEIPGVAERASTRAKLAQLYAERGLRDEAASVRGQGETEVDADLEAAVSLAVSLAASGRLEEAKSEAKRILRSGDVPPEVSTQLRAVLVKGSGRR